MKLIRKKITSRFSSTIRLPHHQQVQLSIVLAKDVLPIFEEKYPNDNRPRLAIEAAESWLADPSEENAEKAKRAGDEARRAGDKAWVDIHEVVNAAYTAAWESANAAAYTAYTAGYVDNADNFDLFYISVAISYSVCCKIDNMITNERNFIRILGKSV